MHSCVLGIYDRPDESKVTENILGVNIVNGRLLTQVATVKVNKKTF